MTLLNQTCPRPRMSTLVTKSFTPNNPFARRSCTSVAAVLAPGWPCLHPGALSPSLRLDTHRTRHARHTDDDSWLML